MSGSVTGYLTVIIDRVVWNEPPAGSTDPSKAGKATASGQCPAPYARLKWWGSKIEIDLQPIAGTLTGSSALPAPPVQKLAFPVFTHYNSFLKYLRDMQTLVLDLHDPADDRQCIGHAHVALRALTDRETIDDMVRRTYMHHVQNHWTRHMSRFASHVYVIGVVPSALQFQIQRDDARVLGHIHVVLKAEFPVTRKTTTTSSGSAASTAPAVGPATVSNAPGSTSSSLTAPFPPAAVASAHAPIEFRGAAVPSSSSHTPVQTHAAVHAPHTVSHASIHSAHADPHQVRTTGIPPPCVCLCWCVCVCVRERQRTRLCA